MRTQILKSLLKKKGAKRFFSTLIVAIVTTTLLSQIKFDGLEAKLFDFRTTFANRHEASKDIIIVTIDDKTEEKLDDFSPLIIEHHAELLLQLTNYQPKSVGYLVDFNIVAQNSNNFFESTWSQEFLDRATELQVKGTNLILGTPFDVTGERLPPYPISQVPSALSVLHEDGSQFAGDNITRRALLNLVGKDSFHLELAKSYLGPNKINANTVHGMFIENEINASYFHFRYHRSQNGGLFKPYPVYSFIDIINGIIPKEKIQNKIILIGSSVMENPHDFARTPFEKAPFAFPNFFVHANIIDSIIQNDGISKSSPYFDFILALLCSFTVFYFVISYSPSIGLLITLLEASIVLSISHWAFQGGFGLNGFWINESFPLVGILVTYYLAVPFRLFNEHKKRSDYQQKNKILVEVEQLKSNFLSLVTHDLKTPVARIQGLSEVLRRECGDKLSESDLKNLQHIEASSEELNDFISKILELSKIESDKIHLQLESKDINGIIETVVKKLEHSAKKKNISLSLELEPLFPINIDPSLVSKVLSNIIENAIKYSPDDSTVSISTSEKGEHVQIAITDSGVGISESELKSLFTKFFRAKNESTQLLKGTGLGLYLSKYFIDAHHGKIEIESEKNSGTKVIITLPQNIKRNDLGKNKKQKRREIHV